MMLPYPSTSRNSRVCIPNVRSPRLLSFFFIALATACFYHLQNFETSPTLTEKTPLERNVAPENKLPSFDASVLSDQRAVSIHERLDGFPHDVQMPDALDTAEKVDDSQPSADTQSLPVSIEDIVKSDVESSRPVPSISTTDVKLSQAEKDVNSVLGDDISESPLKESETERVEEDDKSLPQPINSESLDAGEKKEEILSDEGSQKLDETVQKQQVSGDEDVDSHVNTGEKQQTNGADSSEEQVSTSEKEVKDDINDLPRVFQNGLEDSEKQEKDDTAVETEERQTMTENKVDEVSLEGSNVERRAGEELDSNGSLETEESETVRKVGAEADAEVGSEAGSGDGIVMAVPTAEREGANDKKDVVEESKVALPAAERDSLNGEDVDGEKTERPVLVVEEKDGEVNEAEKQKIDVDPTPQGDYEVYATTGNVNGVKPSEKVAALEVSLEGLEDKQAGE